MNEGYMALGIMQYLSYPKIDDYELGFDPRLKLLNETRMKDVIKQFSGWLHSAKQPERYVGSQHPRMRFAASDLQYYIT